MTLGGWILMISTELVFTVALVSCMWLVLIHVPEQDNHEQK
jgi:hypothetical protein